jgi:hypothetical protein
MNVVYSDRAKQPEECFELLIQTTARLKAILGFAQDSIRAHWDRGEDDRGHPLYSLKISDFAGEAEGTFAPDELGRGPHMRVRLASLWDDLLRVRERKQMEALQEPVETEVD